MRPPFDRPSHITAIDGEVVMDGPDGVGHSYTPEAARETGRRLIEAASEAEAQDTAHTEP
ncbi:MAG: hypothetical protein EON94_14185 [Caulobacteraceae bacterium]|nr:MAG: hypothetical protein EON94_14185 [Caulobacteraceae bacterium]